jgi:hypothetical protein
MVRSKTKRIFPYRYTFCLFFLEKMNEEVRQARKQEIDKWHGIRCTVNIRGNARFWLGHHITAQSF